MLFFLVTILLFSKNTNANAKKQTVKICKNFNYIRKSNITVRNGPSQEYYPILQTQRNNIIVEVKYKVDNWSYVQSQDGLKGWIESKYLSNKLKILSLKNDTYLMRLPNKNSEKIIKIKKYEYGKRIFCQENKWCRLSFRNITGWIEAKDLWGIECD
jgi:SH3-like domain-containing protein